MQRNERERVIINIIGMCNDRLLSGGFSVLNSTYGELRGGEFLYIPIGAELLRAEVTYGDQAALLARGVKRSMILRGNLCMYFSTEAVRH